MAKEADLRVCERGHRYYKSSDCPTCPVCNVENRPERGFLSKLSSPARNALVYKEIDTLQKLAGYSEKEILKIHGIGPATMPVLRASLEEEGLSFKS